MATRQSDVHGYLAMASGIVCVNAPFGPLRAHLQRTVKRVQVGPRFDDAVLKHDPDAGGASFPPELLDAQLLRDHELFHFSQLMSTPVGLLLWRAFNTLIVNVDFLLRLLRACPDLSDVELPLHTWFAGGGRAKVMDYLASHATRPVEFEHLPLVVNTPDRLEQFLPRLGGYTDLVVHELTVVEGFLNGMLDRSRLTVGQFAEVATDAMKALDNRSGVGGAVRWTTDLPPETRLIAGDRCATREIVEASARLIEQDYVAGLAPAGSLAGWRGRAIFGEYRPAYQYLHERLGEVEPSQLCIDVALMQPADPAVALALGRSEVRVEDVHPAFTLPRCVTALRERIVVREAGALDALAAADLARAAGLTPAAEIFGARQAIAARLTDEEWMSDNRVRGIKDASGIGFTHTQEEFVRSLALRERAPAGYALRDGRLPFLRPHIELYQDDFMLNIAAIINVPDAATEGGAGQVVFDAIDLMREVLIKFARDSVHLALLTAGGDVSVAHTIRRAVAGRVAKGGDDDVFASALNQIGQHAGHGDVIDVIFPWRAILESYPASLRRLIRWQDSTQ